MPTIPMRLLVTAPTQWDLRPPTVRRPAPRSACIWYLHMRSHKPTGYLEYPLMHTHTFDEAICPSEFSYCHGWRIYSATRPAQDFGVFSYIKFFKSTIILKILWNQERQIIIEFKRYSKLVPLQAMKEYTGKEL